MLFYSHACGHHPTAVEREESLSSSARFSEIKLADTHGANDVNMRDVLWLERTDETVAALRPADETRRGPVAEVVLDDLDTLALPDGHARVGGAEVNADGVLLVAGGVVVHRGAGGRLAVVLHYTSSVHCECAKRAKNLETKTRTNRSGRKIHKMPSLRREQ